MFRLVEESTTIVSRRSSRVGALLALAAITGCSDVDQAESETDVLEQSSEVGPAAELTAGDAVGGGQQPAAAVQLTMLGAMTWGFYDSAIPGRYPTESSQVTAAMNQAVNDYNTVASYTNHVPVTYNPGVPTAQANYNGSISFGSQRSARTAQHEMSHFMGMQPWVSGGKATWSNLCAAGWANTLGLARMRAYSGSSSAGIGCSNDSGHFWDYGLNYDNEWNWLSKGRNVGIVGAIRADVGLADGSSPAPADYRIVNRATSQVGADGPMTEGGSAIGAPSTIASQQAWTLSFSNGFVRLKNVASGRYLDGSGAVASLVSAQNPGAGQTWEMEPSTDGYFQLRNQGSNRCLRAPSAGAALSLAACDTNGDAPNSALQWHLAKTATGTTTGTAKALVSAQSSKCLDAPSANAQTRLWTCNASANQQWTYNAAKELRTPSGQCLDAWGAGTTNGTLVGIWTCNGGANQRWNLNADGTLTGVQSGRCVDVSGAGTADGTKIILWDCWGGANQRWTLK